MSSLHIYTVHLKPDDAAPHETAEFVREGFNWWAFIFNGLWALYYRQWWLAAGLLALEISLSVALNKALLSPEHAAVIKIGFQLLLGFVANDLQRWQLKRQGYITADIVTGDSELAAEHRFFERWLQQTAKPVSATGA